MTFVTCLRFELLVTLAVERASSLGCQEKNQCPKGKGNEAKACANQSEQLIPDGPHSQLPEGAD